MVFDFISLQSATSPYSTANCARRRAAARLIYVFMCKNCTQQTNRWNANDAAACSLTDTATRYASTVHLENIPNWIYNDSIPCCRFTLRRTRAKNATNVICVRMHRFRPGILSRTCWCIPIRSRINANNVIKRSGKPCSHRHPRQTNVYSNFIFLQAKTIAQATH